MTIEQNNEWGDIPQGWEVVALGDFGSVEMCRRIFKHETQTIGDIPFYKIGTFGSQPDAYISSSIFEEYKSKYPYPQVGDILISAAGTIGRIIVFSGEKSYYQDSNIVWLKIDKNKITNPFLYYFYQNTKWTSLEGSTIKRLYNSDLLSKLIVLPPKPEQTAIATVLSDTDKLIDSLTALIAKKQAIKSATMSQLLSGQKRLSEFANHSDGTPKTYIQTDNGKIPEDWEIVALGDLAEIKKGELITAEKKRFGNIPVIAGGKNPAYFHDIANRFGKTITISASGASAGFVNFFKQPIFASDCSTISESKLYSIEYIYYTLLNKQTKIYAMQTGGAQPHVQPSDLKPFLIEIPKLLTEQTAIAQILSDMDSEIIALENRLNKTKALKQGLMHQLLTGKIRLI